MRGLIPFFFASVLIHLGFVLLWGELIPSAYHLPGLENGSETSVFVTVVSEDEITAVEETPATSDSPALSPSRGTENKPQKPSQKTESDNKETDPEEETADVPDEGEQSHASVLASYRPEVDSKPVNTQEEESGRKEMVREICEEQPEKEKIKIAKREEQSRWEAESPTSTASRPSAASPASRFRTSRGRALVDFAAKIRAAIKEATIFPREAARRKQYGTVAVKFTMRRDGSLEDLKVAKSSGKPILDETALKILRRASTNFPPVPPAIRKQTVTYVVPIVFKRKKDKKR